MYMYMYVYMHRAYMYIQSNGVIYSYEKICIWNKTLNGAKGFQDLHSSLNDVYSGSPGHNWCPMKLIVI